VITSRALAGTVLMALVAACTPLIGNSATADLRVQEYALREPPTLDPLVFDPVEGSMESILTAHSAQRAQVPALDSFMLDGHFSVRAVLGQDLLTATEHYSSDGTTGWVTLDRNGHEIYRIDIGMASPVTGLRGLWTYDGHWALETAYVTLDGVGGRLTRDGVVLNDALGYSDVFNFQLMGGRPFYFFVRGGKIGYSYGGRESVPAFDEIPHYGCCSGAELNPRQALGMVAFFAREAGTWYYVEITSRS
jgi:hypothetical protein